MINLYPWVRIVSAIAISYAALVALVAIILSAWFEDTETFRVFSIAISGGILLQLTLYSLVYFLWEKIWIRFPILNTVIFPNLNGEWHMTISWAKSGDSENTESIETSHAIAVIKQNLLTISIEVNSPDSHSITIVAEPKKEPISKTPGIYYIYRVIPDQTKFNDRPEYMGMAFLRYTVNGFDQLKGNYFTARKTKGHFNMVRLP